MSLADTKTQQPASQAAPQSELPAPTRLGDSFELVISPSSVWHIGTGKGVNGGVDRSVVVDRDGLPFIPASSVAGVWRDACERAAWALDRGTAGEWGEWARWIFGGLGDRSGPGGTSNTSRFGPEGSQLKIGAARLDPIVAAAVSADVRLAHATRSVRAATAIDPAKGSAKKGSLRMIEVVNAGGSYVAGVETLGEGLPEEAEALLVAGAVLLERFGGKRRRGYGRCEAWLRVASDESDVVARVAPESWAEYLRAVSPAAAPAMDRAKRDVIDLGSTAKATDSWFVLRLRLGLKQPLAVQSFAKGNMLECYDFIPGATLLPPILGLLGGVSLGSHVATGGVSVGPAVPVIAGERAVPAPKSFALLKDPDAVDTERPTPILNRLAAPEEPGKQYKRFSHGWVVSAHGEGAAVLAADPEKVVTSQNSIDDASQRPTSETGGLFTRVALAPDQVFECEVRLSEAVVAELDAAAGFAGDLQGQVLNLGRARKGGFGAVEVLSADLAQAEEAGLDEGQCHDGPGTRFVLFAETDVVLRDEYLRSAPTAQALAAAVGEVVGVGCTVVDAGSSDLWTSAVAVNRHETWQRRWGLPRPSIATIAAGSVVVVEFNAPTDAGAVRAALRGGVGERRGEGFGRLLVDPEVLSGTGMLAGRVEVRGEAGLAAATPERVDAAPVDDFVATCGRVALRRLIDTAIEARMSDPTWRANNLNGAPESSQLGALRSQLLSVRDADGLNRLHGWFSNGTNGRMHRPKSGWGSFGLTEQVVELSESPDGIWEQLCIDDPSTLLVGLSESAREAELAAVEAYAVVEFLTAGVRRANGDGDDDQSTEEEDV